MHVVLGTDGAGASIIAGGVMPEAERQMTVKGVVKVRSESNAPPPLHAVTVQVVGTAVRPGSGGRYEVALKLNGGRLKLVACGCKTCSAPAYVSVDERSSYHQDLVFQDECLD